MKNKEISKNYELIRIIRHAWWRAFFLAKLVGKKFPQPNRDFWKNFLWTYSPPALKLRGGGILLSSDKNMLFFQKNNILKERIVERRIKWNTKTDL